MILLIDDDSRNIFALKAILKQRGYACTEVYSAAEGIELLNRHNNISLVLLDMMMPEMDGYAALPLIKSRFSVPVIAVTAQAMQGDKEKALQAGADAYLSKPIDVDKLVSLLQQYIKE